ncbi:putative protein OS=Streptomyces fumanus OX=67302 GN=GCM10018772_60570 PE=4 SV=1 [Streptomyces fumanus]|uniref:Uncharacterized protein n=2 Tax=Streptomyces fumanus TaxID=67302 RepID=A0A919E948_9ACTN|nr:hypothetical protein GCM10018772_60570 [Streptomyces fumanus]
MTIWQPDSGETLLARSPVTFATGAAPRVRGMRWFRDPDRNDIQHELPGWPEGPSFIARSVGGGVAERSLRGAAVAAGVAVMAFLSSAGGNLSGGSTADGEGSDTPDVPQDEVEDFPVMWAAPGGIARTLPWQLDPGRENQKLFTTHLIVTDRRLVIVHLPYYGKELGRIEDDVLWQCTRSDIQQVTRRNFKDGTDFVIAFVDGSWCRLRSIRRVQLLRYLAPPRDLLALTDLAPDQKKTVLAFAEEHESPGTPFPIVSRNPTGRLRVETFPLSRYTSAFGAAEVNITMDSDGRKVDVGDYLPEDF